MSILEDELKKKFQSDYENYKNTKAKIALIGQPGAGKSSLINALVGEHLFEVGVHTDTTTEAQEVTFGPLIITDLPGYGTELFPLDSWLLKFKPEQYDLYLFVFSGKLYDSDEALFSYLKQWQSERQHPYFIIRTKEDDLWDPEISIEELKNIIIDDVTSKIKDSNAKVYFVSSRKNSGIDELKKAILDSPLDKLIKSKLISSFKARNLDDLNAKRAECNNIIHLAALSSAVNGFNPIPGSDILIDFGILKEMLNQIASSFGLSDIQNKSKYEKYGPLAASIVNRILMYLEEKGIEQFLKFLIEKFGEKILLQKGTKYIPLIGNLISGGVAAAMAEIMGQEFADDCYELSKIILEDTLNNKV